jgi:hypothetical protein
LYGGIQDKEDEMARVVADMSMSLDGFVAGPGDGKDHPHGRHGGVHIFDWYFSGNEEFRGLREDQPNMGMVKGFQQAVSQMDALLAGRTASG